MESLVSSKWLNEHLTDPDLIILDASLKKNINGKVSNEQHIRIKGARFFDLTNDFSDSNSLYPNMLITPSDFETACQNLGINEASKIVVYDHMGIYSSPRVWWMFKTMGHDAIAVLDGGLPDWIKKGGVTIGIQEEKFTKGNFKAHVREEMVSGFDVVISNSQQPTKLLIDARSNGRFKGIAPEPRKGLRSGHIPNSINIPFENVIKNGKFKPKSALNIIFDAVIKENKPLIFSCGSGLTACIVLLASELVLNCEKSVYDGSWTEWAQRVK